MVGTRTRAAADKVAKEVQRVAQVADSRTAYEDLRTATLEENRRRFLELGLEHLASRFSPSKSVRKFKPKLSQPLLPPGVIRRSSRLLRSPPISYRETRPTSKEDVDVVEVKRKQRHSTKPEIYTEEHEKLLGPCGKEWKLFTDGCANGSRVYDQVNGKTCHQCRQKTLGHRTWCYSCRALHGQFCGDCLYMRYGENVLEAKANKQWTCPVCRDICNCSLCRPRKGWAPTGAMYRKAQAHGYKSVAHYLIFTRRAGMVSEVKAEEDDVLILGS